ncbi:hypothetical protein LEP1GSC038_0464 [Leptospira weilii str. 2006001855]|uniref:Uncharacterized protein n=1 Tax=Leptospira weilii str. 2006001855 TaxID=996804 RepID=M6FKB8_9LEPT|nr:hypothetical protein LEP1GSC051_4416 [Leptospira sp. P2653]EMM71597.1 hypothetical protein LEP1GSC038_0464 [Leptospira weilii str. 2006001855]
MRTYVLLQTYGTITADFSKVFGTDFHKNLRVLQKSPDQLIKFLSKHRSEFLES